MIEGKPETGGKRRMWASAANRIVGTAAVIALAFGLWQYKGEKFQPPEKTMESGYIPQSSQENISTPAKTGLRPITYSDDQKFQIFEAAKKAGVKTAFLPTMIDTVSAPYVQTGDNSLTLRYLSVIINESSQKITGGDAKTGETNVQLKNGISAKWIDVSNQAGTSRLLTFQMNGVYISVMVPSGKDVNEQTIQAIAESLQPLDRPSPFNVNDWHAVSKPYFVQGTVVSIDNTSNPAWTSLNLKIERYINSNEPPTLDWRNREFQIGKTASIGFYKLADKGKSNLEPGGKVIVKIAQYSAPMGTISWGSIFNDVYYEQNGKYFNPEGKEFIQ